MKVNSGFDVIDFSYICTMQKKLALFFSIFLLALSIMPCADLHTEGEGMAISIDTTHEHQEEHQDVCPPFCSCNCCSSSIVCGLANVYSEIEINAPETIDRYQSEYFFNYHNGIWQPPRLV